MASTTLTNQLQELERFIAQENLLKTSVSAASTYWHIAHVLTVLSAISSVLTTSTPASYKPRFSFMKVAILTTGFIPRGKARAPQETAPSKALTQESLHSTMYQVHDQLQELPQLPATACFKHPYFGWLNKKQTLRFMEIHTRHHLKIIKDIVAC